MGRACGLQALWCVAFRPGLDPPSFWLSGALLAAESVALAGAHGQLRAAVHAVPLSAYFCCHLPLSLRVMDHRARCSASVGGARVAVARRRERRSPPASAWVSLAAGATVTVTSGDPVYALTLAWALAAVAADDRENRDGDDVRRSRLNENVSRTTPREGGEIARRRRGARRVREGVLRGKRGTRVYATIRVEIEA